MQVANISDAVAIAGGQNQTLILRSNGTLWNCGQNNYGMLGNGTTVDSYVPVQVSGLTGVVDMASGDFHEIALKSDGTLWAWGYNNIGALGNGTFIDSNVPIQVPNLCPVLTGIKDETSVSIFTIFPNPSSDVININFTSLQQNAIIHLMDITGKSIYTVAVPWTIQNIEIDVKRFSNGIYFLTLQSGEFSHSEKIVIMK